MPELPAVTDPKILDSFWDNTEEDSESSKSKGKPPPKKAHWRDLELIGDAHLLWQVRTELRQICGETNWHLVKVLEEHAKGNAFLVQVGKFYKLDEWVKTRPSCFKDWADLVEAWIGAVIKEKRLFDEKDPLEYLNFFVARIWRIRYRNLKEYFIGFHGVSRDGDNDVKFLKPRAVKVPGDPTIRRWVDVQSADRIIGYQVTASIIQNSIKARGFAVTPEEARKNAKQRALRINRGNTSYDNDNAEVNGSSRNKNE